MGSTVQTALPPTIIGSTMPCWHEVVGRWPLVIGQTLKRDALMCIKRDAARRLAANHQGQTALVDRFMSSTFPPTSHKTVEIRFLDDPSTESTASASSVLEILSL